MEIDDTLYFQRVSGLRMARIAMAPMGALSGDGNYASEFLRIHFTYPWTPEWSRDLGLFHSRTSYIVQFSCVNSIDVINCPQQGGSHLSQKILTGHTYTVGLSVAGAVTGSSHGNYHSTVDPMITSDPSFANAELYSLSLGDGIGARLVVLQAKRFRRFRI